MKYSPHQPRYKPMDNQSNGTRIRPYVAYNENAPHYQVANYTATPDVRKNYTNKSLDAKRILDANTHRVVETQPSILKRFVTAVLTAKNTVKEAIREFFSRKQKK